MPSVRAELESGPNAGSMTPISDVPTFGRINTCLDARAVGEFGLPPQAARTRSSTLKNKSRPGSRRALEGVIWLGKQNLTFCSSLTGTLNAGHSLAHHCTVSYFRRARERCLSA